MIDNVQEQRYSI